MARQKKYHTEEEKKEVHRLAMKKYRQTEKGKEKVKKYFATEEGREARKRYASSKKGKEARKKYMQTETGKEKTKTAIMKWRFSDEGKEKIKTGIKKWRSSDKGKQYFKRYYSRYENKLRKNLSTRIYLALKRRGGNKSKKTIELIGGDIDYLRTHLEKQFKPMMNWNNYGVWHVDHIKPVDKFDLTDLEQQKVCFNYKNLQPLWGSENLKKSNKWNSNLNQKNDDTETITDL